MKKKFLLTLLAVVCALCCAFAFAACGDDGEQKKTHSQQQWQNAFDAALWQEQDHVFEGGTLLKKEQDCSFGGGSYFDGYAQNYQIDVKKDAQNALYSYRPDADRGLNSGYDWVMKKGDKYYTQYSWEHNNFAIELTADIYASKETQLTHEKSQVSYVPAILGQLRDRYADFSKTDSIGEARHCTGYTLKNVTLTLGETEVSVARVFVGIYDDADELYKVVLGGVFSTGAYEGTIVNAVYTYSRNPSGMDPLYFVILPEIEGKTFSMGNYELDLSHFDSDPEKHDNYQEILGRLFSPNYDGKKATLHADGTITGDMTFGEVPISTYTWSGDIADVTVTNANNVDVAESDKFTLTGALETTEDGHRLALHFSVPMGGGDTVPVTIYFIYASV